MPTIKACKRGLLEASEERKKAELGQGQLSAAGISALLQALGKNGPQVNEYFIKIKGTPIKSGGRTEATEHQKIIKARDGDSAMMLFSKEYDIQELIAINKL